MKGYAIFAWCYELTCSLLAWSNDVEYWGWKLMVPSGAGEVKTIGLGDSAMADCLAVGS